MTHNIKVLIVEDQAIVAEDIATKLRKHSLEVTDVCSSGESALRSVRENAPDLILMDIQLEGKMDGIETAREMQKHHSIPIIYLSDLRDKVTLDRAKRTLPETYLTKPFNELDLVRAIDLAFYRSQYPTREKVVAEYVFLRTESQVYIKVQIRDILYLEAERAYCKIVCKDKTHLLSTSMNHVHNQINNANFIKVHRSFIINMESISGFDGNTVKIGEQEIVMNKDAKDELTGKLKFVR